MCHVFSICQSLFRCLLILMASKRQGKETQQMVFTEMGFFCSGYICISTYLGSVDPLALLAVSFASRKHMVHVFLATVFKGVCAFFIPLGEDSFLNSSHLTFCIYGLCRLGSKNIFVFVNRVILVCLNWFIWLCTGRRLAYVRRNCTFWLPLTTFRLKRIKPVNMICSRGINPPTTVVVFFFRVRDVLILIISLFQKCRFALCAI